MTQQLRHFLMLAGALVGFTILAVGAQAYHIRYGVFAMPELAPRTAAALCEPNNGLSEIRVTGLWQARPRYTFVCENGAHFPDATVVPEARLARKPGDPIPTASLLK